MAEQTASIVVDAAPAEIMNVIGDFPAYPEWAKGAQCPRSSPSSTTGGPSGSSSPST